jgi:hypothetical protein
MLRENATFRKLDLFPSSGEEGRIHLLGWAPYKEIISIIGQLLSDLHSCLITWDQAKSAEDNQEIYNKNCDKARACRGTGIEEEVEICATNITNKTKCVSANAKKWKKYRTMEKVQNPSNFTDEVVLNLCWMRYPWALLESFRGRGPTKKNACKTNAYTFYVYCRESTKSV